MAAMNRGAGIERANKRIAGGQVALGDEADITGPVLLELMKLKQIVSENCWKKWKLNKIPFRCCKSKCENDARWQ